MPSNTTCAYVIKRNGAYLIHNVDPTGDDVYEAASSLTIAKRVAREQAREHEYVGPFRWIHLEPTLWELDGRYDYGD